MWRIGGWPQLTAWVVALAAIISMIAFPLPWLVGVPVAGVALVSAEWGHRRFHQQLARQPGLEQVKRPNAVRIWLAIIGVLVLLRVASSVGVPDWLLTGLPIAVLAGLIVWFVIKMRNQGRD
jgi:hypothetical protein